MALLNKYLQQVLHDQRIARHRYSIAFLELNNFDLYKWWDFKEQGFQETETDVNCLQDSKSNVPKTTLAKQKDIDPPDNQISFKNRSNSLYTERSEDAKQRTQAIDAINKQEKRRTASISDTKMQPISSPDDPPLLTVLEAMEDQSSAPSTCKAQISALEHAVPVQGEQTLI